MNVLSPVNKASKNLPAIYQCLCETISTINLNHIQVLIKHYNLFFNTKNFYQYKKRPLASIDHQPSAEMCFVVVESLGRAKNMS